MVPYFRYFCLGLVLVRIFAGTGHAQDAYAPGEIDPWAWTGDPVPPPDTSKDKSDYTLFNPVPDEDMRQFSTDRPGKTHSSLTVDAGHYQLESDFYNYTYDHYSPNQQTTRLSSLATPILKAGVTDWADIEAAFDMYSALHTTDRTTSTSLNAHGFGDFALGSKINLFGNDGGAQSLALLPFIQFPTAATNVGTGGTEYTLAVPYTIDLDTLWSVTMEPGLGYLTNIDNNAHHGDYSFIVNVNRPVAFKTVTAALELASDYASGGGITPRYTLDPSLQWLVTPAFQLDMGVYIGLNREAPDYNPYVGVSFRY